MGKISKFVILLPAIVASINLQNVTPRQMVEYFCGAFSTNGILPIEDGVLLVTVSTFSAKGLEKYNADDFPEVECSEIQELTDPLFGEKSKLSDIQKYCIPHRILKLYVPSASRLDLEKKAVLLQERNDIESVSLNYLNGSLANTPNDSLFYLQWGPASANLPQAWDTETGTSSTKIGVIDTGIEGNHPDLCNCIDSSLSHWCGSGYSNPLEDLVGHGTHVGGIVGATGNNGVGVAGTCWNVDLVFIKVSDTADQISQASIASGIVYAESIGLPIVNFSIVGPDNPAVSAAVDDYSGLLVCSAGNNGQNSDVYPLYPAAYSSQIIISVGWLESDNTCAPNSNYGATSVDLFAPGDNIYSTYKNQSYTSLSGTSMASPFVSGTAGLLLSQYPYLSTSDLKTSILNNVSLVSGLTCSSNGKLNSYSAIQNPYHSHLYTSSYSFFPHLSTPLIANVAPPKKNFTQFRAEQPIPLTAALMEDAWIVDMLLI